MQLIFKCHLIAQLLLQLFTCKIVQDSFDYIKLNILQSKLGCFVWMQIVCKVLSQHYVINKQYIVLHGITILKIPVTVSYNKITLSGVLIVT